jgi:hypothetical protein
MKLAQALQAIAVTVTLSFVSVGFSTTVAAQNASAAAQDVIYINNNTRDPIALQMGRDRLEIGSGIMASYRVHGNTKVCLGNALNRTKQACFPIKGGRSYKVIRGSNGMVRLIPVADVFVVRQN